MSMIPPFVSMAVITDENNESATSIQPVPCHGRVSRNSLCHGFRRIDHLRSFISIPIKHNITYNLIFIYKSFWFSLYFDNCGYASPFSTQSFSIPNKHEVINSYFIPWCKNIIGLKLF